MLPSTARRLRHLDRIHREQQLRAIAPPDPHNALKVDEQEDAPTQQAQETTPEKEEGQRTP